MKQDEVRYPTREEIEQWMREAKADNVEAQYQLGICYANGYGVKIDMIKAMEYFEAAANQGHTEALYQMGNSYYYGYGVPLDYSKAVDYWEEAALRGNIRAQYQTGCCYEHGQGVDINCKQAIYWYHKAAEQNDADAIYVLSTHCYKDAEKAFELCKKAAELGNVEAQLHMGFYYDGDDFVRPNFEKALYWYTQAAEQGNETATCCMAELDEAREKTEEWIHEAETGDPEVLFQLAECYEYGVGIEHDYELAKRYYTRAFEEGNQEEEENTIALYFDKITYKEKMAYLDKLLQMEKWEEMAEGGDEAAMLLLWKYYEYDADYEEDLKPKRAIYWLRKAAEIGNAQAQVILGSHYELGNQVLIDFEEAFRLYSLAAKQSDDTGLYEIGHCYEHGIGVEKDIVEAIREYNNSACLGNAEAKSALLRIKDWHTSPEHENLEYANLAREALEKVNKEERQ